MTNYMGNWLFFCLHELLDSVQVLLRGVNGASCLLEKPGVVHEKYKLAFHSGE